MPGTLKYIVPREGKDMESNEPTPGLWTFSDDGRGIYAILCDGVMLAQVWRVTPGCDGDLPAEANARLMSAAPLLLAELKGIRLVCERRDDPPSIILDNIESCVRAAISKAEGK